MRIGLALLLVACGSKPPSPPPTNAAPADEGPRAAVRGFVEALAADDVARARSYIPDDAACAHARPVFVADCKRTAPVERQMIPLIHDIPRSSHVTAVTRVRGAAGYPELGVWTFDLDGKPAGTLITIELAGKSYVMLAPGATDM